ncbi:FAD-dependent monooxygenase [Streptomyces sp. NPDC001978]|uniref:FAD-dependent monooxygenase n=1 Tax=Streptomyces sp. NPDC001978 TaxID=3364627 RepID=UPI0036A900F8
MRTPLHRPHRQETPAGTAPPSLGGPNPTPAAHQGAAAAVRPPGRAARTGHAKKIVCVGGGPAGLYFAIAAKRRDAGLDITVIERDPPGATYGWGVGYGDDLLDHLYCNDPDSAQAVRAASALWQDQEVRLGEETAYLGRYGFSIARATLLDILTRRATELGVDVQHRRTVEDLAELADADLIVACDGANSRVRQLHGDHFSTRLQVGRNPYMWLGTDKVFPRFTFAFEPTPAGWVWFYAYPSSAGISTCVIECAPETWRGLGLDALDSADGVRLLEQIFASALDGHALLGRSRGEPARWQHFTEVRNATWYHDNVVLLGDAAHTTHYTLGSGTRLALLDAIELAHSLYTQAELPAALHAYDGRRRAALHPVQAAARTSMAWFEHLDRHLEQDLVAFAYAMSVRQGVQPPWRYQLHRATQVPVLRRVRREVNGGLRRYLALRRGETALGTGSATRRVTTTAALAAPAAAPAVTDPMRQPQQPGNTELVEP